MLASDDARSRESALEPLPALGDFLKRTSAMAIASSQRGEVGGGNEVGSGKDAVWPPTAAAPHLHPPRWGDVHAGKHRADTSGEPFPEITLATPTVLTPQGCTVRQLHYPPAFVSLPPTLRLSRAWKRKRRRSGRWKASAAAGWFGRDLG